MSSVFSGGASIFIGPNTTQSWTFTFGDSGWQGNTINQPQPLNTDASMTYTNPIVSLNSDGTYSFQEFITNDGPNSTNFNLQTSAS
jgi:hypothetical protein